jgi:hypothetical protein
MSVRTTNESKTALEIDPGPFLLHTRGMTTQREWAKRQRYCTESKSRLRPHVEHDWKIPGLTEFGERVTVTFWDFIETFPPDQWPRTGRKEPSPLTADEMDILDPIKSHVYGFKEYPKPKPSRPATGQRYGYDPDDK